MQAWESHGGIKDQDEYKRCNDPGGCCIVFTLAMRLTGAAGALFHSSKKFFETKFFMCATFLSPGMCYGCKTLKILIEY